MQRRWTGARSPASASWSRPLCLDCKPDAVTLVDGAGNLLAVPAAPGADPLDLGDAEAHPVALEDRLRGKIVQLLERSVGIARVDAAVSADLDFDELATTAETYDPQCQVVRSTQTTEEVTDQQETQPTDQVGAAGNLPTERAAAPAGAPGSSEKGNKIEETINYEISRTVRNQTKRGACCCGGCRSRSRSTAATEHSRTGRPPTSRAVPGSSSSSLPWSAALPALTRAGRSGRGGEPPVRHRRHPAGAGGRDGLAADARGRICPVPSTSASSAC